MKKIPKTSTLNKDQLDSIVSSVKKKYGADSISTLSDSSEFATVKNFISFGHWGLNNIVSGLSNNGGLPEGRLTEIYGDLSTGKCIRNSYISTENGLELIDDIGDKMPFGATKKVLQLYDGTEGVVNTDTFWKEKVPETIKIKSRHGFEIEGTPDHKILTFQPDSTFQMVKLKDLKVSDYVIIGRNEQPFPEGYWDMSHINIKYKHKQHPVNMPDRLNEDVAYLAGYLSQRGGLEKGQYTFFSNVVRVEKMLTSILYSFNLEKRIKHIFSHWGVHSIHFNHYMSEVLGFPRSVFSSVKKKISTKILTSPKSVQAAFLRGVFDAAGMFHKRTIYSPIIEIELNSLEFGKQLQLMLLRFGILSVRAEKTKITGDEVVFTERISNTVKMKFDNALLFLNKIRSYKFIPSCKTEDVEVLNEDETYTLPYSSTARKTPKYYDVIPFTGEKYTKEIEEFIRPLYWVNNGFIMFDGEWQNSKLVVRLYASNMTYHKLNNILKYMTIFEPCLDLTFYRDLVRRNYLYDKVEKIIHNKKETIVYDVHIPKSHLFWSNGFISHNSLIIAHLISECQKSGGIAVLDDTEHAYLKEFGEMIGVNNNELIYMASDTVEEVFDKMELIIKGLTEQFPDKPILYAWDSLALVQSNKESESEMEQSGFGTDKAKAIHKGSRKLVSLIGKSRVCFVIANQTRHKVGIAYGDPETTPGGDAIPFWASVRIRLSKKELIRATDKKDSEVLGVKGEAIVKKNKITKPFQHCYFEIYFDKGLKYTSGALDLLIRKGVAVEGESKGQYIIGGVQKRKADWESEFNKNPSLLDNIL